MLSKIYLTLYNVKFTTPTWILNDSSETQTHRHRHRHRHTHKNGCVDDGLEFLVQTKKVSLTGY